MEDISSIENQYKSNKLYLISAIAALLFGMYFNEITYGFLSAMVFLVLWWFSRKHTITIKPDGGNEINIVAKRMNKKDIDEFIFNIVKAKSERINKIYGIKAGEDQSA